MSIDAIADALLVTCESSIKSLSQSLTTLHSIDALHRLKAKADVVEAFSVIISFAAFLTPTPPPAAAPSTDVDESLLEARLERLERRAEMLRRDRLAVLGEHQDETTALAHTSVSTHSSTLEDGRDDDLQPPSSQSTLRDFPIHPLPLDDYSDLLHGPRPSSAKLDEWKLDQAKTKPLYSILVYFPILTSRRMWVTGKEREMLARIVLPSSDVDGVSTESHLLATEIYPRIRLLDRPTWNDGGRQNIALILDDNPGRLRAAQMRLIAAQRSYWGDPQSSSLIKEKASIFVRKWEERPSILVFTYSASTPDATRKIKEIRHDPAMLVKAVFERYPVLARFQPLADCNPKTGDGSNLCRLPGGGGRVYYAPPTSYNGSSREECHTLFVPLFPGTNSQEAFRGSNEDLEEFCQDFASENSPFMFDNCLEFTITCHTLSDPPLPLLPLRW